VVLREEPVLKNLVILLVSCGYAKYMTYVSETCYTCTRLAVSAMSVHTKAVMFRGMSRIVFLSLRHFKYRIFKIEVLT